MTDRGQESLDKKLTKAIETPPQILGTPARQRGEADKLARETLNKATQKLQQLLQAHTEQEKVQAVINDELRKRGLK